MNRPSQGGIPVNCPNCGMQFPAMVQSVIDGGNDPNAKARFLSGQVNQAQCPNCSAVVQLAVPLVYHDHSKELLLIHLPEQLNIPPQEREGMVGRITREIMNSLPQEQRKGYLFNPIQPLTLQGMIKIVLEKDGITDEMIQAQQEKMDLIETFMRAKNDDLDGLVAQHDAILDDEFFQLMTLSAEAALASGKRQAGEAIISRRNQLIEKSSYGQQAMLDAEAQQVIIQEVADWLNSKGQQLDAAELVDYIVENADSDDHLQALVGLARPVFSYQFFQMMSDQATKSVNTRAAKINHARDRLVELTTAIDQQQQAMMQQAQGIIEDMLNAPNQEEAIAERLDLIDQTMLQILDAMIQQYQQRQDLITSSRLKSLQDKIMEQLRAKAPPEIRFINDLLSEEDPIERKLMLSEHAGEYGENLLRYMDALIENFNDGSDEAQMIIDQLNELKEAAARIITGT